MVLLEVLGQAGPGRLPSEQFPGDGGRGGGVQGDEVAQVGEVFTSIGRGHRRRGDAEVTTHRLGDLAEGDALVGDRVQDRAGGGGLDGPAGQGGGGGGGARPPAGGAPPPDAPPPPPGGGGPRG